MAMHARNGPSSALELGLHFANGKESEYKLIKYLKLNLIISKISLMLGDF